MMTLEELNQKKENMQMAKTVLKVNSKEEIQNLCAFHNDYHWMSGQKAVDIPPGIRLLSFPTWILLNHEKKTIGWTGPSVYDPVETHKYFDSLNNADTYVAAKRATNQ